MIQPTQYGGLSLSFTSFETDSCCSGVSQPGCNELVHGMMLQSGLRMAVFFQKPDVYWNSHWDTSIKSDRIRDTLTGLLSNQSLDGDVAIGLSYIMTSG